MAAPAPPPVFARPAVYLPEAEAAKEWDRLAEAHQLHGATVAFLKAHFGRIELFAKLTAAEITSLPTQINLQDSAKMDATGVLVETAKLRNVQAQLQQQLEAYSASGTAKEEVELDAPLGAAELANLMDAFRRIHRFFWPPEQAPSDQLVSRCWREFQKRALTLRPLDKCRTQADSQHAGSTKSAPVAGAKVDARIVIGAAEQVSPLGSAYDVLFRIKLLLRAMAIAGVQQITPAQELPDELDGDSTQHRVCPWDVVFRVECRIERCMRDVPYEQTRGWLLRQFDAEQRYWIEKVRNNRTITIGQVLLQSLTERESVWTQPCVPSPVREKPQRVAEAASSRPVKPAKSEQGHSLFPLSFCTSYNKGHCKFGDKCHFPHRCSRVTGYQADGTAHYCNERHPEKEHDSSARKRKKGVGKGSKDKARRRLARASGSGSKGSGGKR
jgi:hypothetical protein